MLELLAFLKDETDKATMDEKLQALAEAIQENAANVDLLERAINAGTSRERIMMGILVLTSMVAIGMCIFLASKLDRASKRLDALETRPGQQLAA